MNDPKIYVPGLWKCPKCNFKQHNNVIHPGGISANVKPELRPCPNDGRDMVPVLWRDYAHEADKFAKRLLEDKFNLEEELKSIREALTNAEFVLHRRSLVTMVQLLIEESTRDKITVTHWKHPDCDEVLISKGTADESRSEAEDTFSDDPTRLTWEERQMSAVAFRCLPEFQS